MQYRKVIRTLRVPDQNKSLQVVNGCLKLDYDKNYYDVINSDYYKPFHDNLTIFIKSLSILK